MFFVKKLFALQVLRMHLSFVLMRLSLLMQLEKEALPDL